jgi:hypothetical protein
MPLVRPDWVNFLWKSAVVVIDLCGRRSDADSRLPGNPISAVPSPHLPAYMPSHFNTSFGVLTPGVFSEVLAREIGAGRG